MAGEKDGDALSGNGCEGFVDNFDDMPVSGRNDGRRIAWNRAIGIAKEIEDEETEKNQHSARPFPSNGDAYNSSDERRQSKPVSVFDHGQFYRILKANFRGTISMEVPRNFSPG
jgi:hypothetical protein